LAYPKGDIIAESCVHGEVRNIKIPDVFLVKDLPYNSLSVSNLDRKGFIINIDKSKAKIIKNSTVVGIANRDGNFYKLNMTIKEVDDSEAHSAVSMNNSKIWHSRMGHNQLQQLAKIVDGMNIKLNNNETEVCEICVSGKQTRMPHNHTRVKTRRPLERIHSDLVDPIDTVSYNGNRYILTLLDDYTQFSVAFPMKSKADVLLLELEFVHLDVTMEENICQRKSRIILEAKE
jgi:hypothetical protein